MASIVICRKCKGEGKKRKGVDCPTCGGSGRVLVQQGKDGGVTVLGPVTK